MKVIDKISFDTNKLQQVAQDILNEAARLGANQAEVGIGTNKGFSVSVRGGSVETVEYHQDKAVEVTVFFGKRTGSASFSDLTPDAIRAAVEAACHIAKFTDEDPAAGLADQSELAFQYPQLDMLYPWRISVEDAIKLACQCEQEALAYDKRIMSAEDIRITTAEAFGLHANSLGFMGCFPYTRHEISCVLVAKERDEMQRDYSYTTACDPDMLESVSIIAKEAADKVVNRLGARRIPTMKTPVIYIAEEARGLLGHFAAAIQGGSLYRKASFLLDHLNKKIFPEFIFIQEFPHLPRALGSAPFDDDGVVTQANIFVEDGRLQNYSLGIYSARKLGMKTTGNAGGTHNLTIRPGDKDLKALMKKMDKGLLITEMMGQGANLVTGDYSRGVAGFWVEQGDIQYPVHEITVANKLQNMYQQILDVGNDVDTRGNIRTGSILLEEMMVAGE
ncbi:MAG: metalloprotease PmbA [Gammaproteobacteria bacterium RIFCSPHIGHO2_12_FULL_37_14]|nr:MAG: metalloprotease PmbA [Gammaproteobacteria bacterium RIFCSPHIGHO2_12_FULL_37_14]